MPERKREVTETSSTINDAQDTDELARKRKAADEKIYHGKKLLYRSLKVAKGFERQKLSKRHKIAQQANSASETARIDAEIQALKTLDLSVTAESHLYKTLRKDKPLLESPLLPEYVKSAEKVLLDTAASNVTARLLNSQPVKQALKEATFIIRKALGFRDAGQNPRGLRAKKSEESKDENTQHVENEKPSAEFAVDNTELDDEHDDESYQPESMEDTNVHDSNDEKGNLNMRIASGSENDSENDNQLVNATVGELNQVKHASNPATSHSLSSSRSASYSPMPTPRSGKPHKLENGISSSTYLPSLTMGGYISGSDSDSAIEDDVERIQPKKNRRGQRARQKIWEQKYGNRAKHLNKTPTSKDAQSRDSGWDAKRGAQLASTGREGRYQPKWKTERAQDGARQIFPTKGNAVNATNPNPKPQIDDMKGLHPSWEAARKAKEEKKPAKFEGKKVVF